MSYLLNPILLFPPRLILAIKINIIFRQVELEAPHRLYLSRDIMHSLLLRPDLKHKHELIFELDFSI
jgi:hypothetical protein